MRPSILRFAALSLASCVAAGVAAQDTSTWSRFRAEATAPNALPDGDFGLNVAWTRDLGAGYSHVSIANGRVVTMFTSGDRDVVAAFETNSGAELWRYDLGEKYLGHDGSTDGPLSTPTLHDDAVYVLGPNGQLAALDFASGQERWRVTLDEESSTTPFYGYTTSPIVSGDLIVVATGGDGQAVTAFDRASGERRWAVGDDSVTYQTPSLMQLDGRHQLVAVTDRFLQGLDHESGEILWQHRHTEGDQTEGSSHAAQVDSNRFLVDYGRGSKLYRVENGTVEELWETNAFANSFATPILIGDHMYGFTGNFMTCVDVETGKIVWRSRPPGGQGISRVGDLLAVINPDGDLVLVEPSPEGYREVTRTAALDIGDYAAPSFADGTFVVRNLTQLAALRVDSSATPQVGRAVKEDRLKGAFGEWVAELEKKAEAERQAEVDEHLSNFERTPILGDGGLVHFVWKGEAKDVGLRGDPIPQGREVGMYQVAGTDLFFHSLELDPKAQYTYNFTVDFGQPTPDPANSDNVDLGFRVTSELRMAQWPASPHLDEPTEDTPRGSMDTFQFSSESLENTREIRVWRPAGYNPSGDTRYPVLIVNHGDNLLRGGLMQNTLDNLVGKSVAPLIAVFVPRAAGPEYGGPGSDQYTQFLVDELLPHVDRHYRTDPENRAIMGPGSAGVAAVYAALQRPDVFRQAATQSFYPIEPADAKITELAGAEADKPQRVHVVWSRNDYDLGGGRRADEASRALIEQLTAAGVDVSETISNYSPGWGGWRGQHDELLAAMFPPTASE